MCGGKKSPEKQPQILSISYVAIFRSERKLNWKLIKVFVSLQLENTSLVNCNFLQNCVHGSHKTPSTMSNTNPNAGHSGHNNILSNFIHAMNHSAYNAMTSSGDGASLASVCNSANRQQPLLQGTLYKLHKKSGKKQKYFVIFDDAPDKPGTARLEYFDNEKKFRSAMAKSPDNGITNQKRSIILSSCFNINRRIDTPKYKYVIGLYRNNDTFSIIMKDEKEMNEWLNQLLILQRGKEFLDGDQPRPKFGKFFFLYFHKHLSPSLYEDIYVKKINFNWVTCQISCRSLNKPSGVAEFHLRVLQKAYAHLTIRKRNICEHRAPITCK